MNSLVFLARGWITLTLMLQRHRARQVLGGGPAVLADFFSPRLLGATWFVCVDAMPSPPLAGLLLGRTGGRLFDRHDQGADGLTLRNTYFLLPHVCGEASLHCHELVHVCQWRLLGERRFLAIWLEQIRRGRYHDNPLERIAFRVQGEFDSAGRPFDAERRVRDLLLAAGLRGLASLP